MKIPEIGNKRPKLIIDTKLFKFNPVNPKLAIEEKNPYMKPKTINETKIIIKKCETTMNKICKALKFNRNNIKEYP